MDSFNEAYDGRYFADIEFIPRNDSGGGYSDKINSSVLSGGLPDVLTLDGPNVAAYAANNIIQPLAPLTEEERSEYLESILDQGTYNDQLYVLGVMESSVGLYYNKDILETLKPIMDEKRGYPLDMTFPVGEASINYYAPFIWANGGNLVSEDGLTVDGYFNSEQNVETMNYFRSIVESGVRMWEIAKSLPSTYRAFEQIDIFQTDENYNALYLQLSEYGHPRPKTPVYPQVSTSFQQVLESAALGGKDAKTELDKSVERINAKLERYIRK